MIICLGRLVRLNRTLPLVLLSIDRCGIDAFAGNIPWECLLSISTTTGQRPAANEERKVASIYLALCEHSRTLSTYSSLSTQWHLTPLAFLNLGHSASSCHNLTCQLIYSAQLVIPLLPHLSSYLLLMLRFRTCSRDWWQEAKTLEVSSCNLLSCTPADSRVSQCIHLCMVSLHSRE